MKRIEWKMQQKHILLQQQHQWQWWVKNKSAIEETEIEWWKEEGQNEKKHSSHFFGTS